MGSLFRVLIVACAGLALAGCNRSQPQTAPASAPAPAVAAPPATPQPAAPAPIPPSTELPLNSVDSVMLSRPADAPMAIVVQVSGMAPSAGWTGVKLVEDTDANGDASIKTYKLVATSPAMPDENRNPETLQAELRVDSLAPEVKTIRIVSATNEISAPIAE